MAEIGAKRIGTISRVEEVYSICQDCGQGHWGRVDKGYKFCKVCGTEVGKSVTMGGFVYIRIAQDDPYLAMCPKKTGLFTTGDWLRRSRYVMAQQLGRCLTEDEQVWHKNSDKTDDKPENLVLHTIAHKLEQTEEETRKTRAYKFGFNEGYEAGYEEGYREKHPDYPPLDPVPSGSAPQGAKKLAREENETMSEFWKGKAKERKQAK